MRKQYHFRRSEHDVYAWDVDRLVALTRDFLHVEVSLSLSREPDEPIGFGPGGVPTCRAIMEHPRLMEAADLSDPIILSCDGRVMDGTTAFARQRCSAAQRS